MTKAVTKSKEQEKAVCVTLNPSEAETLADFLGLTMVAAIQEKTNGIENPEYIEELAAIYRKCAVAARAAGTSETPLVFQTEKRYLNKGGYVKVGVFGDGEIHAKGRIRTLVHSAEDASREVHHNRNDL